MAVDRVSNIMNLLGHAPEIQQAIRELPLGTPRSVMSEHGLRELARLSVGEQQARWSQTVRTASVGDDRHRRRQCRPPATTRFRQKPSRTHCGTARATPTGVPPSAHSEYKRPRPDQTVLFGIVRDHLNGFQERCREAYGKLPPRYRPT